MFKLVGRKLLSVVYRRVYQPKVARKVDRRNRLHNAEAVFESEEIDEAQCAAHWLSAIVFTQQI